MKINNILIDKFFSNQCTAEEAEFVISYLQGHPEKLDDFLPEQLWNRETETAAGATFKKEELLQLIKENAGINRKNSRLIFRFSVAASVVVAIGCFLWISNSKKEVAVDVKPILEQHMAYTLVKINYGKEDMLLYTDDGSVISLKPGGEIRYLEHLTKENRDFTLKGTARFKVAKDKQRPFHVHAGGTVTTALGTDFTISAAEPDATVSITLHSGKVVVDAENRKMKKVYLLPGNRLLVNKINFNIQLLSSIAQTPATMAEGQTELTETKVSFRNQSLDKIFALLGSTFSTPISFNKAEVRGMFFTGSFNRNEQTVQNILNEIALLNHLNIEKRDSVYILTPQSKQKR